MRCLCLAIGLAATLAAAAYAGPPHGNPLSDQRGKQGYPPWGEGPVAGQAAGPIRQTAATQFATAPNPPPAVVRVITPQRDGMAYGSGTLVAVNASQGLVLTNWHVVEDAAGTIMVVFPDGFCSAAKVLKADRDWDLAALVIWRPSVEPIPLAQQAPRPGEMLTIAGYGSGWYRAAAGRCTQYVSPGKNQPFEMVELSAPARQGDSGGPIFNGRGELAGVLFGTAGGVTTGSYCGRVRQFLASLDATFQHGGTGPLVVAQAVPPPSLSLPPPPANNPLRPPAEFAARAAPPLGRMAANNTQPPSPLAPNAGSPPRSPYPHPEAAIPSEAAVPPAPAVPTLPSPFATSGDPWGGERVMAGSPMSPAQDDGSPDGGEADEPLTEAAATTPGEKLKTILAVVGVIAILFHGVRFISSLARE